MLNPSSGFRHRDTGSGSLSYKGCGQSASVTLAIEGLEVSIDLSNLSGLAIEEL